MADELDPPVTAIAGLAAAIFMVCVVSRAAQASYLVTQALWLGLPEEGEKSNKRKDDDKEESHFAVCQYVEKRTGSAIKQRNCNLKYYFFLKKHTIYRDFNVSSWNWFENFYAFNLKKINPSEKCQVSEIELQIG